MTKTLIARQLAEQKYEAGYRPKNLLSRGNAKLLKSERTLGLSLSPAATSGFQVCASSSVECRKHCIHTSGHGSENFHEAGLPCNPIWVARALKTLWFFRDRKAFMHKLFRDIANNRDASIRLNVFSDWMWERQPLTITPEDAKHYGVAAGNFRSVLEVFPNTQFYDYTKHFNRVIRGVPPNYHLTFSLTEANKAQALSVLSAGGNVAAVTSRSEGHLFGWPIIDGDVNDLRFLDPRGSIVGLKPKGSLRNSESEFIHEPDGIQWSTFKAA